jgi:PhoH-like ATPase
MAKDKNAGRIRKDQLLSEDAGGSASSASGSGSRSRGSGSSGGSASSGYETGQNARSTPLPQRTMPSSPPRSLPARVDSSRTDPSKVVPSRVSALPSQNRRPSLTMGTPGKVKHFVIDTNVLLHDPGALFVFEEHEVIIPLTVIEELDRFKRDDGDRGRNARQCIRHLDRLREIGRLVDGVRWGEACDIEDKLRPGPSDAKTGSVRIDVSEFSREGVLREDKPDNRIIAIASGLQRKLSGTGEEVIFVSKDLNARIKADAIGLKTEDFENKKVDTEQLYSGFMSLEVEGELIDELYRDRLLPVDRIADLLTFPSIDGSSFVRPLYANQFVQLRDREDENHTGLARRLADTDHLIPVTGPRKPTFGILPRNVQQTMALDLLLDEEIRMVTLMGGAGTGKTLLAVAAGMAKTFNEERYDKMLVARPIMPLGRDIGYLPGTKDDKLSAWMQPIFDNVSYLLSTRGSPMQHADSKSTEQRIASLMDSGKLVLEPLTYIRGRSIPHQFMIVDEAQNLTPHEIKTIISRIGEGTKVILTGDIEQIDNPYLDAALNGLSYAVERMKGLRIVGHVTLNKSERSELASLAAAML